MAKPIEINKSNFEDVVLKSDKPVLIDFWAAWCGPCKLIAPHVEALADELEGQAVIGKLDVDQNPELSAQFGVMSIPTLLVVKNGEVVDRKVGAIPKAAISDLVLAHAN